MEHTGIVIGLKAYFLIVFVNVHGLRFIEVKASKSSMRRHKKKINLSNSNTSQNCKT